MPLLAFWVSFPSLPVVVLVVVVVVVGVVRKDLLEAAKVGLVPIVARVELDVDLGELAS